MVSPVIILLRPSHKELCWELLGYDHNVVLVVQRLPRIRASSLK